MAEDFHVSPPALVKLGGAFSGQRRCVDGLCGPAQQCASTVDTGDAALDASTKALIDTVDNLFRKFGDGLR